MMYSPSRKMCSRNEVLLSLGNLVARNVMFTKQTKNGIINHRGMFTKIIIANRGEIACRIMKTASLMNVKTVAVYSDADSDALHVAMADEAYRIGPSTVSESYLKTDTLIEVAKRSGAEGIHPGYGFLSENADFAESCSNSGLTFIGPSASAIRSMGSKSMAKTIMSSAGVPVTPGYHGDNQTPKNLYTEAEKIGYPILIKAVSGGGGKGMRIVYEKEHFFESLDSCCRESLNSFGDARVLLEKYIIESRHVEVQIFADMYGNAVYLHERDCSVQRRHQKVIEEAPAPNLPDKIRKNLGEAAVRAAAAVGYVGAGTVEFLMDSYTQEFYFCEMNTRLQVEHPVTEMITGHDLVEWQLRVASGQPLPVTSQDALVPKGHAIEARIYAENTEKGFLPCTGRLTRFRVPHKSPHTRVDTGIREGDTVSMFYDPMIAKVICWGENRTQALQKLADSLRQFQITGIPTNIEFCERVLRHPSFKAGDVTTKFLEHHSESIMNLKLGKYPNHAVTLATITFMLHEKGAISNNDKYINLEGKDQYLSFHDPSSASGSEDLSHSDCSNCSSGPFSPLSGPWRIIGNSRRVLFFSTGKDTNEKQSVVVDCLLDGSYKVNGTHVFGSISKHGVLNAVIDNHRYILPTAYECSKVSSEVSIVMWNPSGPLEGDTSNRFRYDLTFSKRNKFVLKDDSTVTSSMLKSPMPGKVIRVLVKANEKVETGQALIIIEAMKMEHSITASAFGTVHSVHIEEGQMVTDAMVLISMKDKSTNP